MGKKSKKAQKIRKHEYVIFIVGGILAVAAAIYAAYYSAQSGEIAMDGYRIRIHTANYVYDGFIYFSKTGQVLRTKIPMSVKGRGNGAVLRIPADLQSPESVSDFVKGGPGDIVYDPARKEIIIFGETQDKPGKALRLGKLDDFLNLNWNESVAVSVRIELKQ